VVDFRSVHISADGECVAGGGSCSQGGGGFVVFFANATTKTGYIGSPTWLSYNYISGMVIDLALSDDGYGVAAMTVTPMSLHYWANATMLTGEPNATWTNSGQFGSVDMNAMGNKVLAGGIGVRSLHYWGDARDRSGTQLEDWIALEGADVIDVAMSKDGNIIAAPCQTGLSEYTAFFLHSNGTIIGNCSLQQLCTMVSMSADGGTIAIAGPGYDSLYVFKAYVDSTPPAINDVYQIPPADNVTPADQVQILANVTDSESGVKKVTLNYIASGGNWSSTPMDPYSRDIYNGTIPAFALGTNVTYEIIAEDNANNTKCSEQEGYTLEYQVVPEFTPTLLTILLMTTALLQILARKKQKKN
jgi:hypothetical protein